MAEHVFMDKVRTSAKRKKLRKKVICPPNYLDFKYKYVTESHYTNDKFISNSQNRYRASSMTNLINTAFKLIRYCTAIILVLYVYKTTKYSGWLYYI